MVPRIEGALDRVDVLLDRADAAVLRVERAADDTDGLVIRRRRRWSGHASALIDGMSPVLASAQVAVARVGGVLDDASAL
jgi:hypothetical protein